MATLITGASGFLGRHLLGALVHAGKDVIAFGRSRPPGGSGDFINGDLASGRGLAEVPWNRINAVFHLAAAGVKSQRREWLETVSTNVVGMQRLLSMIERHAPSTSVVVASTFYETAVRDVPQLQQNPYIVTKAAGSELVRQWAAGYRGRVVLARIFQVYGADDAADNVLNCAERNLRENQPSTFGSGTGRRDWIHVLDAVAALQHSLIGEQGLHEFDIGTGTLHSVREMIERLAHLMGLSTAQFTFDAALDRGDTTIALRAERQPEGWRPAVSVDEGLRSFLRHAAVGCDAAVIAGSKNNVRQG